MKNIFLHIYDFLSSHRVLSMSLLLMMVIGGLFMASSITYEEDISKFLPTTDKERFAQLYTRLAEQDKIVIMFQPTDSAVTPDIDSMQKAMEYYGDLLEEKQCVGDFSVTTDLGGQDQLLSHLSDLYPYLLTESDVERMDSLLETPSFVAQQLQFDKMMLSMPSSSVFSATMDADPLQLFTPVLQRMSMLSPNVGYQLIDGYIFDQDCRFSLFACSSPFGGNETEQNTRLCATLDSISQQTTSKYPSISVSTIGGPVMAVANARQIKHDASTAILISVVVIVILLYLHYRRWSDMLWIVASVVFGAIFALATLSVFKSSLSIIVIGIGSVMIGIAVNYPLHYLDHLQEISDRRTALKDMVAPLLIGNITTVAAFLCLLWLDASAMRDLGAFGALTLIGTILFVLIFLPLLVKKNDKHAGINFSLDFLNLSSRRQKRWFVIGLVLLTAVLGYFSTFTSFDSDLHHINYMTHQQRHDFELLQSGVKSDPLYVVSEGMTLDEALFNNEKLCDSLRKEPGVTTITGIDGVLTSKALQVQRLQRWNSFTTRHKHLVQQFKDECGKQGFDVSAFSPFLSLWEKTDTVSADNQYLLSMVEGKYVIEEENGYTIVNLVECSDATGLKQRYHTAFSSADVGNQLVRVLNDSFNYVGWVCGFVVFFFLWLSFRRIELALTAFLPLAVSWIWILGLMHLFGVQFNIVNIILATFIFGQGDDYTIFITEGLTHEFATGEKRLKGYKNSVALSSIIMLVGIGTLVIARHPALRSLAFVTIIGMFTVVVMAYYLPPLVFQWLTTRKGSVRQVPLTIKRFAYSLFSITFFIVIMYLFVLPFTWLYFHLGKNTESRKLRYHRFLQKMSSFVIHHVPGVKYSVDNSVGETFEKPAVMVCNHQSHLDLMCIMMLTPKVVFLTNDWVWRNPFYGLVVHRAEFYPISNGVENNIEQLRNLYERSYSIVIFPEGTRSEDSRILRFHKGAFYLAEQLGADILPLMIHGAGHVLPKKDFMLRQGQIHLKVFERKAMAADARSMTKVIHHFYLDRYKSLCEERETFSYWAVFVRYQYMYKGSSTERRVSYSLAHPEAPDSGLGEKAFVRALQNPEEDVVFGTYNKDDYKVMSQLAHVPMNLHFELYGER